VAQQKLDLFQLAPGAVAEAGTRSSQVMRREFYDSNLACVPLDDMPHHLFGHFGAPNRSRPADATKYPTVGNSRRCEPIVDGSLNPSGHWYGSNVTGFTYQIDDGPVILATLEVVNGEFSQFAPPQATTQ
jgi:hypothetical protein